MKTIISAKAGRIASVAVLSGLLAASVVFAAVETLPQGPTNIDEFLALLDKAANWIFSILLVVAVIAILVAAFMFVTAGGDPGKTGQARQMLLYAAIGIVVAVSAKGIVTVVKTFVTQP